MDPKAAKLRDRLCELKKAYAKSTGLRPTHISLTYDDARDLGSNDLLGHPARIGEPLLGMEIATIGTYDKTQVYAGLVELEVFRGIVSVVNLPPGITLKIHDFDVLDVTGTRRRGQHSDRKEPCMTSEYQGPVST